MDFAVSPPSIYLFLAQKKKKKKRKALKKKSVHYHVVIMAGTNPSTKAKPTRLETARDPLAWLTSHH